MYRIIKCALNGEVEFNIIIKSSAMFTTNFNLDTVYCSKIDYLCRIILLYVTDEI